MASTPLQLAIQVFYFFWAVLGISLLLIHIELYVSGKFKLVPRYYLGALALFAISPIFYALGAYWKPAVTFANTFYILAFVEFALSVKELSSEVTKRVFRVLLLFTLIYFLVFEYLRQLGPNFFIERVLITNIPAILFVVLSIFWIHKANNKNPIAQLKILIAILLVLMFFLALRCYHLLVYGAPGVGSIYQEQEQWMLWVRIINGALIFLSTLILHNYFFKMNWQQNILIASENERIRNLLLERDSLITSLIKANKTAATGALSASLAHELSQPLGASSLNIQFLKRKLLEGNIDQSLLLDMMGSLESDNQRAIKILESLRSIFSQNKGDADPINLKNAIDILLEIARPEFRKFNIQLEVNVDSSLELKIPITELHQVLLNLLNNSIQALTLPHFMKPERFICIRGYRTDAEIAITVSDNGPGVPESIRSNLFELLSTSKDTGMGLGLWLCKHIVTQNGGSITYGASKRGGAQFVISFPLSTPMLY